jgi:hypothetical protein
METGCAAVLYVVAVVIYMIVAIKNRVYAVDVPAQNGIVAKKPSPAAPGGSGQRAGARR